MDKLNYDNIEISYNNLTLTYKFNKNELKNATNLINKTLNSLEFKEIKKILLKTKTQEIDITVLSELIFKYNANINSYHNLFKEEEYEWCLILKKKKNQRLNIIFDMNKTAPVFIEKTPTPNNKTEVKTDIKKLKYTEMCILYFNLKKIDIWKELDNLIQTTDQETIKLNIAEIKKSKAIQSYPSFTAYVYSDKIYLKAHKDKYDDKELAIFKEKYTIIKVTMDDKLLNMNNWINQLNPHAKKTILYIKKQPTYMKG